MSERGEVGYRKGTVSPLERFIPPSNFDPAYTLYTRCVHVLSAMRLVPESVGSMWESNRWFDSGLSLAPPISFRSYCSRRVITLIRHHTACIFNVSSALHIPDASFPPLHRGPSTNTTWPAAVSGHHSFPLPPENLHCLQLSCSAPLPWIFSEHISSTCFRRLTCLE